VAVRSVPTDASLRWLYLALKTLDTLYENRVNGCESSGRLPMTGVRTMPKSLFVVLALICSTVHAGSMNFSTNVHAPVFDRGICVSHTPEFVLQRAGEPGMPFQTVRFLVPFGERVTDVSVMLTGFKEVPGTFSIVPAKAPVPLDGSRLITVKNETIYNSDDPYPFEKFVLHETQRLAGFDIVTITIFPYTYVPKEGRLGYFEDITVEVSTEFDATVKAAQERMISRSSCVVERLERLVENPDVVDSYPFANGRAATRELIDPADPHRFLIITGSAFSGIFETYAAWKEACGVSSIVFAIEDVYAEYTVGDEPARLRDFIIDAYQAWAGTDQPLEFVLLGGDDEIIPVRGCWGHNSYYGTDYHIPCDLYYGCLDGDWNANGNQYYGEIDDDPDLYPEVHVGRFPGDNAADFQNMIRKIMDYVDDPWPNIYTALMVGEQLAANPPFWGGDLCDLICDDPAYLPAYYYVTKMYDRDGTFSTGAVRDHLNNSGSALGFHAGHTNYNYLMGLSPYDIDNLYNERYPFFSSGGCHTLAFDQATSGNLEAIGEHALFADAAMMEFLGHSRYGFSNWTYFMQKLLEGIFTEGISSIGASLSYSRGQLVHLIDNELYRWEYYELILAGDPEIHLVYEAPPLTNLEATVMGSELMLSWTAVDQAAYYWIYGAPNDQYFVPGWAPDFENRLDVVTQGTTTWMSPYPVGNPLSNWTYMIVAMDDSDLELGRSNRAGEYDISLDIPSENDCHSD
jgi:hypothetical protein